MKRLTVEEAEQEHKEVMQWCIGRTVCIDDMNLTLIRDMADAEYWIKTFNDYETIEEFELDTCYTIDMLIGNYVMLYGTTKPYKIESYDKAYAEEHGEEVDLSEFI